MKREKNTPNDAAAATTPATSWTSPKRIGDVAPVPKSRLASPEDPSPKTIMMDHHHTSAPTTTTSLFDSVVVTTAGSNSSHSSSSRGLRDVLQRLELPFPVDEKTTGTQPTTTEEVLSKALREVHLAEDDDEEEDGTETSLEHSSISSV